MDKFSVFFEEHDAIRKLFGMPDLKQPLQLDPNGPVIQAFARNKLISEIANYKIGSASGKILLNDVRWGEGSGSIRLKISPNYLVMVEKLTEDLNGHPIWVCKRVSKIRISEFTGEELTVAKDIYKLLIESSEEQTDAAKDNFNMDGLLRRIVYRVRRLTGPFVFESVKSPEDNNPNRKILLFGVTGSGVGQLVRQTPSQGLTPAALLELAFLKDRGILKTIFTTLGQDAKSGAWQIQIPYFEAYFAPTQLSESIARILFSAIRLI